MIVKKEKKGNVTIFYVEKDYDDNKLLSVLNTKLTKIDKIITTDTDVYTVEGELLLRFRKKILNTKSIELFYDNVIKFAVNTTSNRGSVTGSKIKSFKTNKRIMTNIIGYFDIIGPSQKISLRKLGLTLPVNVRECRFNMDYPDKFQKLLPLIKEIDTHYKHYIPDKYKSQNKKAKETLFKIPNTSFTTITTNVNFQTTVHTDRGDDVDGFGNLSVIGHGKYTGGETCFPQYGVGVDVQTGDLLFMNVHKAHGNLPIVLENSEAKRLSIVCYLRRQVWLKTRNKPQKFKDNQLKLIRSLRLSKPKTLKTLKRKKSSIISTRNRTKTY
jgi:hypothetical protein